MSAKGLYCSFCGKSQHEVRKLIAGPVVFICDECVDLCHDISHPDDDRKIDHAAIHAAQATLRLFQLRCVELKLLLQDFHAQAEKVEAMLSALDNRGHAVGPGEIVPLPRIDDDPVGFAK
jgi:hypothetical protein